MGIKFQEAVIAVDCQFDFTIAGSLPVPGADGRWISEIIFFLASQVYPVGRRILIASKDSHPDNHISFTKWPRHCVRGTPGSELVFHRRLVGTTIEKGTDRNYDSYSAFADDDGNTTALDHCLKQNGVKQLHIFGLATEYCVKHTVLDALNLGYRVNLYLDLCRGLREWDIDSAVKEMKRRGAIII
jgi:nicotinamidase/pyrazinamidase